MKIQSAVPSILRQRFSGAGLSVASVQIEGEDGTVFAGDLDRLAGVGALVEQVETRFPIVGRDPFEDGLPGWFDGLECLDVEGRVGRWRDVDDALMLPPLHPSGCLRQSMSAPLPFPKSMEAKEELDLTLPCAPFLPCGQAVSLRSARQNERKCPRLSWWICSMGTGAGRRPRRGGWRARVPVGTCFGPPKIGARGFQTRTEPRRPQRPRKSGDGGGSRGQLRGNSPLAKSALQATVVAVQETAPMVKKFRNFAEAEAWEHEHYRSLTPQQRMHELFELIAAVAPDEAELDQRVPRVRRITEQE